jgi:antitoxin component YwqK of YwqJK toxin-antitoxin module
MNKDGCYRNGQRISEQNGEVLTYYYKSGKMKARGKYINGKFEGKWLFYREDGTLSQEGNFKNNKKDGEWKRFGETGKLEYHARFSDGKQIEKYK